MRFNLPLFLVAVAASAVTAADEADAAADAQATGDAQETGDAYRRRCNADNCLRIIRGNQGWPPINMCQSDCSSYLVTTVTPTPPVTTTITNTVTITPGPYYGKRDQAADQAADARRPRVPSYCSDACGSDGWRYRSACSCIGITTYTVYAPTPTITATATATVTACSGGKTWCGGQCKDCNTDHENCGKCGKACKSGEICNKGKCRDYGTCQGAQVCPRWGQQAPSCGGGPRSNCQYGECRMCADGVGRCAPRSATPPCWQQNKQRCNQNGDCPGGYCVRNCCGSFCYYPDKGDICDLSSSPYKLFRK